MEVVELVGDPREVGLDVVQVEVVQDPRLAAPPQQLVGACQGPSEEDTIVLTTFGCGSIIHTNTKTAEEPAHVPATLSPPGTGPTRRPDYLG